MAATSSAVAFARVMARHERASRSSSKRPMRDVRVADVGGQQLHRGRIVAAGPRARRARGPVLDSPTIPAATSEPDDRGARQALHQHRRRHRQERHLQHPAPAAEADGDLHLLPRRAGRVERHRLGRADRGRPPRDRRPTSRRWRSASTSTRSTTSSSTRPATSCWSTPWSSATSGSCSSSPPARPAPAE